MTAPASQPINELTRPRVLVYGKFDKDTIASFVNLTETVYYIEYQSSVSFNEWDCVITNHPFVSYNSIDELPDGRREGQHTWKQDYPSHMSIIYFIPTADQYGRHLVDFSPAEGDSTEPPEAAIIMEHKVVGRHLKYANGLPDYISDLVKENLLPVAKQRQHHLTIHSGKISDSGNSIDIRPFLFGPNDTVLACSYERSDEASVWLIPDDVTNKAEWVSAAFREWHRAYPKRFPVDTSWMSNPRWRSIEEVDVYAQIEANEHELEQAFERYNSTNSALQEKLHEAVDRANSYERSLLSRQDNEFQLAVQRALAALGFTVRDMDSEWPTDARKEDYRITDEADPSWLCIGEAKGFLKGVSEAGLFSLSKWVEFYMTETGGKPPSARWYIVNHFINRDPARRQKILAGRQDIIEQFSSTGGLIIEGYALFEFINHIAKRPDDAVRIRAAMRDATGVLDAEVAREMIMSFQHGK